MKVIACIKASPEAQDIVTQPDRSLDFGRAAWKVGAYDLNAIEAARQLADATGGEVIGISAGGDALDNAKLRKDILSRGLDSLVTVAADPNADSFQTATALRDALDAAGPYDLVLLGAGSSDQYAQQVGNQLGALLGVPTLNAVDGITPGEGTVTVERLLEDCVQVVEVSLPAVLSVTSGINKPRIPGMKDILAAGKKPVTEQTADLVAASVHPVSTLAPEKVERSQTLLEGDPTEAAHQLAAFLKTL